MQCPKCGFIMSELDTECLRCKRSGGSAVAVPAVTAQAMREEEKECPRCGKAALASATLCDKCGYEYQPDLSRAERYQALLAEEGALAPPSGLRRTIAPALSWSIIGACLLAIGGAGWGMFGGSLIGSGAENVMDSPIITSHHKAHHGVGIQAVTYNVTGTAAQAVITYRSADGALVATPAAVSLPWIETIRAKTGAHLSLAAKPSDQKGTVTVAIRVGGVTRKQADTPGANGLTTVNDTL
jgi:ribosomal protein S27AE